MISNYLIPIVVAIVGALVSGLIASVGYFAKSKLESMDEKLDSLQTHLDEIENDREEEHDIVIEWLIRITEEVEGVNTPEEVQDTKSFED